MEKETSQQREWLISDKQRGRVLITTTIVFWPWYEVLSVNKLCNWESIATRPQPDTSELARTPTRSDEQTNFLLLFSFLLFFHHLYQTHATIIAVDLRLLEQGLAGVRMTERRTRLLCFLLFSPCFMVTSKFKWRKQKKAKQPAVRPSSLRGGEKGTDNLEQTK